MLLEKLISKFKPDPTDKSYPLKNVGEYVRLSGLLRAVPFVWIVDNASTPTTDSSRLQLLTGWRLFLWKLVTLKTFTFFAYLLIDFYFQYPSYLARHDILYGYLHLFWITGFFVLSAVRLHFWLRYTEIVGAVNQMLGLVHNLEHAYPAWGFEFVWTWRILDKLMILALIGSIGCCVPYGLLVLAFQRHRALFYPMLPQNGWIMYGCVLFNMFFISFQVAGYFVESLLHIVYIESIRNCLAVIDRHSSQIPARELIQTHQKIRLLNTAYYVAFGDLGLPAFKLSISTLIIFSTVAAIKFMGQVNFILTTFSLFVSFVTAVAISILLLMAGKITTRSTSVVDSLARKSSASTGTGVGVGDLRQILRLIHSSRVIAINIGGYYIVNRMTPLTYFTLLFSYLITILISFQTQV